MIILRDIEPIIFNFLQIKETLTYATLSKETNEIAKKSGSYNALMKQLAKNRKCSLVDLTIGAIKHGNYELLDLLVKSGMDPCVYFDNNIYKKIPSRHVFKTVSWFNKKMELNLDMDYVVESMLNGLSCDKSDLQLVKDQQQFISNNTKKLEQYINTAFKSKNFELVGWFFEKFPEETNKYFVEFSIWIQSDGILLLNDYGPNVRWLCERGYLKLELDKMHEYLKNIIIEDSASTDIYGDMPMDILKADPSCVKWFVINSALIRKYGPELLPYHDEITKQMYQIIKTIIFNNDIETFNWLCTHKPINVVFHYENIKYAFQYGRIEILEHLIRYKYNLGRPYCYLWTIASLDKTKTLPVLELFEKMDSAPVGINCVLDLTAAAIQFNNPIFLDWLFKRFGLDAQNDYFSEERLDYISDNLSKHKNIDITQFFVDHGFKVYINYNLNSRRGHDNFLNYILANPVIGKHFYHTFSLAFDNIVVTNNLKLLQWYIKNMADFDTNDVVEIVEPIETTETTDIVETNETAKRKTKLNFDANIGHMIIHIIECGTTEAAIWFLDYCWQIDRGRETICGVPTIGMAALFHGKAKVLDWLREHHIWINHPYWLIEILVKGGMFNMIYYLRKYMQVKIHIGLFGLRKLSRPEKLCVSSTDVSDCFEYPQTHITTNL